MSEASEEVEGQGRAGWFHCGKCGGLFAAEIKSEVPDACPHCGQDPVVSESEMASSQAVDGEAPRSDHSGSLGDASRRSSAEKSREKKGGLLSFALIWILVLALLAGAVSYFRGSDDEEDVAGPAINLGTREDRLLSENYHQLKGMVEDYFVEGVPELRTEFVLNPGETLRRMVGFEQENQFVITDQEPENIIARVIETPRGERIETVWSMGPTRKVEAVFAEDEKGEWKIDWPNMVRYSPRNWPLYLAGEGDDEAEFRLLARRRSEDESGLGISSVVLVGPRMDDPGQLGAASPEIPLDPNSRVGRILSAAFAKRDADEGVYGSEAYTLDPRGMIRVRLRIIRDGVAEKSFVIREVVACHWYDFDELGLD